VVGCFSLFNDDVTAKSVNRITFDEVRDKICMVSFFLVGHGVFSSFIIPSVRDWSAYSYDVMSLTRMYCSLSSRISSC